MKRIAIALFSAATLALLAPGAAAQVFTPTYMAPRTSSDVGIYLSEGPGDFALEGILRRGFGGYDLGLRIGLADTHEASLLLGGELRNPLMLGTAPIDFAFTAGAQAVLAGAEAFGAQAGLSIGHTFVPQGANFTFTPYIHPRIALVDAGGVDDDFEVDLLADLGLDFTFGTGLALRFGIVLAEVDGTDAAWGIGLAWR